MPRDEAQQPRLRDQRRQHQQHRALHLHVRSRQASAVERVVEPVARRRAGRLQRPAVARQVLQRRLRALEERVARARRDDDRVFGEDLADHAALGRAGGADHEVDLARAQHRLQRVDEGDDGAQRHLGRLVEQAARGRRQQELRRGRHDAEPHVARHAALHRGELALGVVDVEAHAARPLEQHVAGRRELDAAPRALEERHAAVRLEPAHGARQRRLRAVQLRRRAAHVLVRRDDFEVAEVAKVHVPTPKVL